MVSSCGGGGSGDRGSFLVEIGTSSVAWFVRIFVPGGCESREFSVEKPLKVVVTARGIDEISVQRIELASSIGVVEPEDGSSPTDSNVSAEFFLTESRCSIPVGHVLEAQLTLKFTPQ